MMENVKVRICKHLTHFLRHMNDLSGKNMCLRVC